MRKVVALCDGAPLPDPEAAGRDVLTIGHRGDAADLNLSIPVPVAPLHGQVDPLTSDLLFIAAYALGVDQQIVRHYETDVHGDRWRRDLLLCLPVSAPSVWSSTSVYERLVAALNYATDDEWSFRFTQSSSEVHPHFFLDVPVEPVMGNPDQVVLLSGGLDSACALIEQHASEGRSPLIVSHSPAFHLTARQGHVRDFLMAKFRGWKFPQIPMAVHRADGSDPADYAMRSRSFLFASMGTLAAVNLGLRDVILADNGVVSLNLPISPQITGAHASRSTHPRFIRLFNELLQSVFHRRGPAIQNTLWNRTRAETLEILKEHGCERLIPETISCSHVQGLSGERPQCGVCSQCIDRRMGTEAAGLQEFDPPERYRMNVFTDGLRDWKARAMALSYVRRAHMFLDATPEMIIREFPELIDALPPSGQSQADIARELTALLQRHGREVDEVVKSQLRRYSDQYVRAKLPEESLIVLLGAGRSLESQGALPEPEPAQKGHRPGGRGFGLLLDCWTTCSDLEGRFGSAHAAYRKIERYLKKHPMPDVKPVPLERFPAARSYGRGRRVNGQCAWHRHKEPVPSELLSE
jgi:7-cyano-7-deazaguanine synthase in queuosine biosynthesis